MRRIGIIAVLSLMALALAAVVPAWAAPHFVKNATSVTQVGNNLNVTFKEAGLAAGSVETITLSATATTTYACVNKGGQIPDAANKQTTSTTATTSGQFRADQNGNIVGSLTLSPPGPGTNTLVCPSSQTETLQSVSYSNITLTDQTSGATISF
jgi:type II secretory pathway pseudopilin PulG